MPSIAELVELTNQGEIGKLLAREFKGERGHTYPRQDSDLIITFASEEATPFTYAILKCVTKHFSRLGYSLSLHEPQSSDCLEATIFVEKDGRREDGSIHVVITTHYPFPAPGEGRASLRITTEANV